MLRKAAGLLVFLLLVGSRQEQTANEPEEGGNSGAINVPEGWTLELQTKCGGVLVKLPRRSGGLFSFPFFFSLPASSNILNIRVF